MSTTDLYSPLPPKRHTFETRAVHVVKHELTIALSHDERKLLASLVASPEFRSISFNLDGASYISVVVDQDYRAGIYYGKKLCFYVTSQYHGIYGFVLYSDGELHDHNGKVVSTGPVF